jgi:hypothetical protein
LIIYANTITHRLTYIISFINSQLSEEEWSFTDNITEFADIKGPKINYSPQKISNQEFWLSPHSLLFEKNISIQDVDCFEVSGNNAFFKTSGDFPFDIFAASFYLLSRYEEYLPHKKDMYGRYAHENSLAYKEGFLNKPLVNIWLQEFVVRLKQQFSSFNTRPSSFTFLPTYDIDEAYSYRHKEWWRSIGGAIKSLLKGNWKNFILRQNVITGKAVDPYDNYEWMDNLHTQYILKPRYFFLVSERIGKYDRNILPKKNALQVLIKSHSERYNIGVHPSWQSGDKPFLLKKEIQTIEEITQLKVTSSRQHYIRFALPNTFRQLNELGIKEDFSMGYGSINGFRASVASPYNWYDLEKEKSTDLLLFPFCFMDANSFYEQKLTSQQTLEELQLLYAEVKKVNGMLITIWHNTFLGSDDRFTGWKEIYSGFIKEIMS